MRSSPGGGGQRSAVRRRDRANPVVRSSITNQLRSILAAGAFARNAYLARSDREGDRGQDLTRSTALGVDPSLSYLPHLPGCCLRPQGGNGLAITAGSRQVSA